MELQDIQKIVYQKFNYSGLVFKLRRKGQIGKDISHEAKSLLLQLQHFHIPNSQVHGNSEVPKSGSPKTPYSFGRKSKSYHNQDLLVKIEEFSPLKQEGIDMLTVLQRSSEFITFLGQTSIEPFFFKFLGQARQLQNRDKRSWNIWCNIQSWKSWCSPLPGHRASTQFLLFFRPRVCVISSTSQVIQIQLMVRQGFQPTPSYDLVSTLDHTEELFPSAIEHLSIQDQP